MRECEYVSECKIERVREKVAMGQLVLKCVLVGKRVIARERERE